MVRALLSSIVRSVFFFFFQSKFLMQSCLCIVLKVVVNQDKTSKQMSALRVEIQKLTMELMEYKQVLFL